MRLNDTKHAPFTGHSSYFPLIRAAIKMKHELATDSESSSPSEDEAMRMSHRRPMFWIQHSDTLPPVPPFTDFPDPAQLHTLLDAYFRLVHVYFPLLHAPTLLRGVAAGLHRADPGFGAVLLLVCALGARFAPECASARGGQCAGWRWFDQVRAARPLIALGATTLADLQVSALAAAYVATLALPHANYTLVGHGLRASLDLGAHRRATYGPTPTIEDELRKRAFWCLVVMDRGMCTILGRPCSIQEEDFDLDYPIECDDEYWVTEDSQQSFKQPSGQPSTVAHFNEFLKLTRIHVRAMRTIYSLQGAKDLQQPERAQEIITDLDSELNKWEASVPEYLKYDPHRTDLPFAAQAASLCAAHHSLRIFIHRPFIIESTRASVPFPSRAICTNAARSCIQMLERYFALSGPGLIYQYHIGSLFQAALVTLLHIWQSMRTGTADGFAEEFALVARALRVFSSLESHWDVAGRFWDMLQDLAGAVEARVRRGAYGPVHPASTSTIPTAAAAAPGMAHGYEAGLDGTNALFASQPAFWGDPLADAYGGPSDPDLEALFADLLPTLAFDGPFFAPDVPPNGGTNPGTAPPPYGHVLADGWGPEFGVGARPWPSGADEWLSDRATR
ncbi:fungal specific transcription factor domain-containing protein [Phanerochaete sordida]|uniref:Fungal specific transcription factor domain-containing protein n=1 Tax=Phanerochaete sordida TaxID=48140 RepID=A0A9P3G986_9APHY|nr:fungal specific transcription factor domain-containing protein [Phanerochaete sordida]